MDEVEGNFVIIPMRNEKYVVISPAPEALRQGTIRKAGLATKEGPGTEVPFSALPLLSRRERLEQFCDHLVDPLLLLLGR